MKEVGVGASDAFCHALTLLGEDTPKAALADLNVGKAREALSSFFTTIYSFNRKTFWQFLLAGSPGTEKSCRKTRDQICCVKSVSCLWIADS